MIRVWLRNAMIMRAIAHCIAHIASMIVIICRMAARAVASVNVLGRFARPSISG